MPKLVTETAGTKASPSRNGSILAQARPVSVAKSTHIKMVIYGDNRVGKTTLACTFPKPLLLISFEPAEAGGAESVSNVDGVDLLQLNSREEFLRLCDELKGPNEYATAVLDTGTSLQDCILREILGLEKLPEQIAFGSVKKPQYFMRADQTKEALRPFLRLPMHTLILNKEKDHRPKDRETIDMTPDFVSPVKLDSFIASDLGGGSVGWLHDACPCICRLYIADVVEQKEIGIKGGPKVPMYTKVGTERRLLTLLQTNFAAGMRAPRGDGIPNVPVYVSEPSFDKIQLVLSGVGILEGG